MISHRSSSGKSEQCSDTASNATQSTHSTATKGNALFDSHFEQALINQGIYPVAYQYPDGRVSAKPDNWDEITRTLDQSRTSLSPSKFLEEEFRKFTHADACQKEVNRSVIPILEGEIADSRCVMGGSKLTNLDQLTDLRLASPISITVHVPNNLNHYSIDSTHNTRFYLTWSTRINAKMTDDIDQGTGNRGCWERYVQLLPPPLFFHRSWSFVISSSVVSRCRTITSLPRVCGLGFEILCYIIFSCDTLFSLGVTYRLYTHGFSFSRGNWNIYDNVQARVGKLSWALLTLMKPRWFRFLIRRDCLSEVETSF